MKFMSSLAALSTWLHFRLQSNGLSLKEEALSAAKMVPNAKNDSEGSKEMLLSVFGIEDQVLINTKSLEAYHGGPWHEDPPTHSYRKQSSIFGKRYYKGQLFEVGRLQCGERASVSATKVGRPEK